MFNPTVNKMLGLTTLPFFLIVNLINKKPFCKAIVVWGDGIKSGSRLVSKTLAEDAKARHLEV